MSTEDSNYDVTDEGKLVKDEDEEANFEEELTFDE